MENTIPDAQGHWLESTRELWNELADKKAKSPGRLELLRQALEARSRAEKARILVETEGRTFKKKTTGAVYVHPAVRIEQDATATFPRAWKALGLAWSHQEGGRSG